MARILLRGALVTAAAVLGTPGIARAHFNLHEPTNWLVQESDGTPQKMGHCGDPSESQPAAAMSNAVTEYKAGDTIAVKLQEMVTHPGHYRVALSLTGQDGLPDDPAVTKKDDTTNGQCGTAAIMDPPMMPILVDNALEHTTKLNGEQTIMVKLPDGVECEKCTLQVIEFMSNHPAPCFYHHCADIKITSDGSTSSGGMSAGGMSAGGMSAGGMGTSGMSAGGTSGAGMSAGGAAGMSTSAGGIGGMVGQGGGAGTGAVSTMGGSAGTGGASSMGGSTTTMGGTGTTAMGGTGNAAAGLAGTTSAQAGTGTAPPAAEPAKTDEEGGCSVASGRSSSPLALLALLGLAGLRVRRRRSRAAR